MHIINIFHYSTERTGRCKFSTCKEYLETVQAAKKEAARKKQETNSEGKRGASMARLRPYPVMQWLMGQMWSQQQPAEMSQGVYKLL
jgi:hypothetical protein